MTCLQHLEQTSNIDDLKANDCIYILDIVQKHLINDPGVDYTTDLEAMLCKIIYQVPAEDSKKLSDYVLANMEKQSLEYLNICAQKNNLGDSHLEKLGLAIELDLQSQASHYLTQLEEQGINFA